jgi:hypothetical protein
MKARETAKVHGRIRKAGWIPDERAYGEEKCVFDEKYLYKLTIESSTGKKILAVLKFDVTSVKRPLIMITVNITAARGIPDKNRSSSATVFDKPDF